MSVAAESIDQAEHRRWRQLCAIASRLAARHGRTALTVRHAARWLEQSARALRAQEIVVTWTVADAELIRHQLRTHLARDRVFPAAPRVRHERATATEPDAIPTPRSRNTKP